MPFCETFIKICHKTYRGHIKHILWSDETKFTVYIKKTMGGIKTSTEQYPEHTMSVVRHDSGSIVLRQGSWSEMVGRTMLEDNLFEAKKAQSKSKPESPRLETWC
ncbi:hypothetical protein ATANTOWER_018357 [Ataeniobius toweri]|uniref:Uncharacterized protein n=1 Tax=Ataeniobius toweri TaxID=208326 RepID=A0ABU7A8C4_9TELE|nr:hypothetical protein [Ataeniobius toweri]